MEPQSRPRTDTSLTDDSAAQANAYTPLADAAEVHATNRQVACRRRSSSGTRHAPSRRSRSPSHTPTQSSEMTSQSDATVADGAAVQTTNKHVPNRRRSSPGTRRHAPIRWRRRPGHTPTCLLQMTPQSRQRNGTYLTDCTAITATQ
jgi:hypothetical protein